MSSPLLERQPRNNVDWYLHIGRRMLPTSQLEQKNPGKKHPCGYFVVHAIVPGLFFLVWTLILLSLQGQSYAFSREEATAGSLPPSNFFTFVTNVISVDLNSLTLSLLWYPGAYGGCIATTNLTNEETEPHMIEIFLDPTLAPGNSPSGSSNTAPGDPIYRLDVTSFCNFGNPLYVNDLPVFQSDLRLVPWPLKISRQNGSVDGETLVTSTVHKYPRDVYHALVNMTAKDSVTNETLQIEIIITALVPGFIVRSQPLSSRSDANYIMSITLHRSIAAQLYVILVSGCILGVSCILLAVSLDIWLFGYTPRVELLVLPIATLFAFTQLRQTLPGVPSAGTDIDFFINLPCFVLLALASISAILTISTADYEPGNERETRFTRFIRRISRIPSDSAPQTRDSGDGPVKRGSHSTDTENAADPRGGQSQLASHARLTVIQTSHNDSQDGGAQSTDLPSRSTQQAHSGNPGVADSCLSPPIVE
ncbi:hypothetical protein MVEN_01436400 [Mycena venus]|uniref:Transmembrane protein n=1 Tax=Mycena venus TaxID=2733690 RepID=A0A8H6XYZ1_9AGAR|nr:hypothetical protein MVEN_01436400 [Mycena venus]